MRLIDADALREQLEEEVASEWNQKTSPHSWAYAIEDFIDDVDYMPTVDAVPVVHGRWIEETDLSEDVYYDCSVCGESFCFIEGTPKLNLYNYCPNCGAKMEEK